MSKQTHMTSNIRKHAKREINFVISVCFGNNKNFKISLKLNFHMDVDVFITNYIYVDPEIFLFWLDGLTT
jgi:hypothetical protein